MLFLVAAFATLCAFVFSVVSAEMANRREDRKDVINVVASYCEELMGDSGKYWMSEYSDENKIEMGVLRWRISSYTILINRFLQDNFPNNANIEEALERVNEFVGGLNFDLLDRGPNTKKAALSIDSIIQLRLLVSKQKEQGLYDKVWSWVKK